MMFPPDCCYTPATGVLVWLQSANMAWSTDDGRYCLNLVAIGRPAAIMRARKIAKSSIILFH